MTETTALGTICNVCGVEVRDGSQFCYNCGSSVSALQNVNEASAPEVVESKDLVENNMLPDVDKRTPTESTKDRRPGSHRRRNVRRSVLPQEVFWAEPEVFGVRFLVTTIVLATVTTTLLVLAFYFR